MVRQRADELEVIGVAPVPAAHRAARQAQVGMGHHAHGIEALAHPQAVAAGAGAHRVVEGEQARLQLRQRVAALRAGELGGEHQFLALWFVHEGDAGQAIGQAQRGLEGFRQAQLQVLAHLDAVHHGLDAVLLAQVQGRRLVQVHHLAVDAGADETLGAQFLQDVHVLALAVLHHRRQQHQPGVRAQGHDLVHHLADGLRLQGGGVLGAARRTDAREQQAQIVVDLGDGADGGTRVVGGGFLLDGNGR